MSRVVSFFLAERGSRLRSVVLVRAAAGFVFLTQGILKFIDPRMGVLRFTRIGFPLPAFTARFVGTFEVACGALLLVGLWTRLASLPLLAVISTAIATTKIPEFFRAGQGFWFTVSDGRTDLAMLCSLLFLICAGGGRWSVDALRPAGGGSGTGSPAASNGDRRSATPRPHRAEHTDDA